MKILVTGALGFIGQNLCVTLKEMDYEVIAFDKNQSLDDLKSDIKTVDFVVHLAGVNRTQNPSDFYEGNQNLTETIVDLLKQYNPVPLLISSSVQAGNDSDYGQSKKMAEEAVAAYDKGYIFRLHNVYGKWSRPNYNSVIATWCHNISRGLEIRVDNPETTLGFVYIDDVVKTMIEAIKGELNFGLQKVSPVDMVSLGEIKDLLVSFKESRNNLQFPNLETAFSKKLYSTYLSYIPLENMKYPLTMHQDHRGSFTEVLKKEGVGQISINVSKPGITKGEHWHHSKNEKFLVVYGEGEISMRHIITNETHTYSVSGDKLEVVDIPTGYTHNIKNTGTHDMVTLMWANESFDPHNPDTYFLEV